ncbi:MAG: NAD-dependent epimerase/dehydratase family protein [Muribaculaceae bacterium]|nr:NAD-dependent epimerase/dehydratase family protein [Muribaculaceae bacterium]
MKFIITGATSFLGKALVRLLTRRGDEVVAIGRRDNSIFPDNVEYRSLNMDEYFRLTDVDKADVFINLAWAGTGHEGRNNNDIQNKNIVDSLEAIHIAKRLGCRVFIESGSQAEYGLACEMTSEKTECNPISEYGKAKLSLQKQAFELSRELEISYVHLRIFSLIGEEDHDWTLVMSVIEAMLHGKQIGLTACTQTWNFLYVEDAAKMIYAISKHFLKLPSCHQAIYNIASDDTRPLKELVEVIREQAGSNGTCNYGAVRTNNLVSLNPDINSYLSDIGNMEFTPYEEVIKKIIQSKNTTQSNHYDKSL